ncbi:MAG: hypothetical protein GX683_06425 [Ruminococcaceae bacterium]|nr:hypothetical protein [Oscillospiraceae bacterium]
MKKDRTKNVKRGVCFLAADILVIIGAIIVAIKVHSASGAAGVLIVVAVGGLISFALGIAAAMNLVLPRDEKKLAKERQRALLLEQEREKILEGYDLFSSAEEENKQ